MPQNRSTAIALALWLALTVVPEASAESPGKACAALVEARGALWSMIDAKDKSAQDALNARVQKASANLDSVLAGMTGADAQRAADFKTVWDQFKATREKDIIPAIYGGNAKEAKKIADSVQSDRLAKMWDIMSCKVR